MNPRRLIFVCALILFALAITPFFPRARSAQEPATQAERTLMMYMDADNDLELDQMHDLLEMISSSPSQRSKRLDSTRVCELLKDWWL